MTDWEDTKKDWPYREPKAGEVWYWRNWQLQEFPYQVMQVNVPEDKIMLKRIYDLPLDRRRQQFRENRTIIISASSFKAINKHNPKGKFPVWRPHESQPEPEPGSEVIVI